MPNNPVLRPETNIPVTIALKYATGKPVTGPSGNQSMMYSLSDGQVIFLPLDVADQIDQLRLQPNEPFTVVKREVRAGQRKTIAYAVDRLEPAAAPPAAPPPRVAQMPRAAAQSPPSTQAGMPRPARPEPATASSAAAETSVASDLSLGLQASLYAVCLRSAIDALQHMQIYAQQKGLVLQIDTPQVQAAAATMYIQMAKERQVMSSTQQPAVGGGRWPN